MTNTTQKNQHTAGPWESDEFGVVISTGNICDSICETYLYKSGSDKLKEIVPDWEGRQKANAKLIAAAPEMLEALERMLQWLIDVEESHGEPIPTKYKERLQKAPMIEAVKQAIKKAKGQ